jgi:hypothetical protein
MENTSDLPDPASIPVAEIDVSDPRLLEQDA